MKTHAVLTVFVILFVFSAYGERVDISLDPAHWMDYGTVTSPRTLTQTAEGYLRATCNTSNGSIYYRTVNTYNFQGATVRYKWRVNCGGNYCWTQDGCYPWGRMATQNLTTNHSWISSIVISTNVWIYTEVRFNTNRTWSINYSYSGYGEGGINSNAGTITETNWNLLANSFIHKLLGDGYAYSFYYEIAEAYYETPGPQPAIVSPADGTAFSPEESISFEATASGGTEPYVFEWESDIDGALGSGPTRVTDALSEGAHTITVTCTDAEDHSGSASIIVLVTVPPVIEPIADHSITDSGSYNGPVPVLTQGDMAVAWSLAEGPAGMTINADTGQVLWAAPVTSGSPYTVTIRAENPKGSDQVSWQLEVITTPSFATTLWGVIHDGQRGYDGHDAFSRTAIDKDGNVLAAGYIDSVAGHQDAAYLVKFSPEGQVLWSKTIDALSYSGKAEYNDRFSDVAIDSDNNVIVVGSKSGNWTGYSLGSYHTAFWVQKYTPDGETLLWEKLWQDTGNSAWQGALGVCIDASDNVYVTGSSFGSWGSGPQHQWITFKYDKNGNVLLGPIRVNFVNYIYLPDYAYDIAVDAAGDMYVAGTRGVSGTDGGIYNNLDWHVRKFNGSTGATLWEDTYSGAAGRLDYAIGVVLDSQGNLLAVGYTNKGTDNSTNINYDWLMIKYNGATGARLWTQTYESRAGASEVCYQAVVDDNDDFYVSGYLQKVGGVLQRRIAKISGMDGTTLAEAVWASEYNSYLTGLDRRGELLAASGMLSNGTDNDAFASLLTVSLAVRIAEPDFNTWFEYGQPVSFVAELAGFAEPPYFYSWTSDKDGDLGTGHTLDYSGLSLGEHLITCHLNYGDGETMQSSIRITVAMAPEIAALDDAIIGEGQPYTGPTPTVNEEALPVVWTLVEGPPAMTINAATGRVAWANPVGAADPYTVTIQAQNPLGADQTSWQLSVLSLPQIETPPTQTAIEFITFTSLAPTLLKGTPPVEWTLVSGPAGMTIDPAAGTVSWDSPLPSFSAYSITIRATNTVGSAAATFFVWVHSAPQIALLADTLINGSQPYGAAPTLIKGVPAVTWSLDAAPAGMTINADTGAVSWPSPGPEDSLHTVTVRAANALGSHTQSWQLHVMLPPVFEPLANDTVHEGVPYQKSVALSQGTAPLTFTLLGKPAGMTVNAATGELSLGYPNGNYSPYTVTVRAANAVGAAQASYTLTVLQRPVIMPIANALTAENNPYAAPVPGLYQGSAPITWTLLAAPEGMTVDAQSGAVSWPTAVYAGSPHTVTLAAQNVVGSDNRSWQVTVVRPPVIAAYGDKTAGNATSYIAPLPGLTQGTHVTWSLDEAPAGMTIVPSTGQMVWPSPVASDVPHTIVLRAQNIAGSATETFGLTIYSKPVLASIANVEMAENKPYSGSPAALLAGQSPVTFSLTQAPAGMTVDAATGAISWAKPTAVGSPHTVRLRATNPYGSDEKTFSAVVPIGYAAEVETDIDTVPSGTPIPLYGRAFYLADGTNAAGAAVHLHVKVRNTLREYKVTTNEQGEFAFTFVPVSGEAGQYAVMAGHPLAVPQAAQDSFTLAALRAADATMRPDLIEAAWYETTVHLTNPGDGPLTQIQAEKIGGPDTIEIDFTPLATLAGDAVEAATLRLRAVDASVRQGVVSVRFSSDQGATAVLAYAVRVIPLTPELAVYPTALEAGMVRGLSRTLSFEVYNKGGKPTPELSVLIPDAPWLSMNNPVVIGVHQPDQSTVITLTLSPDAALPLGPYQGSIYIYGSEMSQAVPFTFNCVSDQVARLDVKAVDEFTYYAEGSPLVENAQLTLRDAFTRDALYLNEPLPGGRLLLEDVPEGYYTLDLAAPEHGAYRATLYAAPGVTSTITAFMPRELVKYIWTVTPTEIQDVYTVTLDTIFETHVPAPVVVIEPANVDLSKMVDGQMQVDFTITNHGLVAAEEFHLAFDEHLRYRVELLTAFNGRVGPGETIVIPATVYDMSYGMMRTTEGVLSPFLGDCDPVKGGGYYTLVCGSDGKWKRVPVTLANWACDLVNIIRGIGGGDDDDYDDDNDYEDDSAPRDEPREGVRSPVTPPPSDGGLVRPAPPPGGPTPPRRPGESPKAPYTPPPRITVGGSGGKSCDPCPRLMMEAILDCALSLLPMSTQLSAVKDVMVCFDGCYGFEATSDKCFKKCTDPLISMIPVVGDIYSIFDCIRSIITACDAKNESAYQAAAAEYMSLTGIELPAQMPSSQDAMDYLIEHYSRMKTIADAMNYVLGDTVWMQGQAGQEQITADWFEAYRSAIEETGDEGETITADERAVLMAMTLPAQIVPDDVDTLCDRWNRTLEYWQAGTFDTSDLPPGDNADFIAMDVFRSRSIEALDAIAANEAMGFEGLYEGLDDAVNVLKAEVDEEARGVCAKVQLQIQQSAVLTRTGFTAELQMQNLSNVDAMDNLAVEVLVTDVLDGDATLLFGIYPPIVTGVSDVDGGGRLSPGAEFKAQWLIVPTLDAAPLEQTYYFVGGSIHYAINGRAVTIPIMPDTITVKPDANLNLKYFFERDVYGDDPFTENVIEPSVPFVLGLMVGNTGAGSAYNMTIQSAQPTIVRRQEDKDILIDFELIDVQVGDQPRVPSLQVSLGHIVPGGSQTAVWRMQSSLQGRFIDYSAQFAHTDTLGDPRLSLIQSVSTHELIRAVLAQRPGDDAVLDFLTNDIPDADSLPDTLHVSAGTVEPVAAHRGDVLWLSGTPESGQVTLTLPQTPSGFFYVRLPNPGWPDYTLIQVVRSDGKLLPPENAWTTYKMNYPEDKAPYAEIGLHLFDDNGTGLYTLMFEPAEDTPPIVLETIVGNIESLSAVPLPLIVTYTDDTAVDPDSLGDGNIRVLGPEGRTLEVRFIEILSEQGGRTTVLYHILPPGDLWEASLNGVYSIALDDAQVADSGGQYAHGVSLGGFVVSVNECVSIDIHQAVLIAQRRLSRTVFEMDYAAVVQNRCDTPIRNLRLIPHSAPANLEVLTHNLRFCYIPARGQAVSEGTFTVRIDYDDPPAPGETFQWQRVVFHPADFTMNGAVDLEDLAGFAFGWLTDDPCFDWAPVPHGDGRVDLLDFNLLAEHWMDSGQ